MTREEAITEIFKKYNVPTSNPFFFEILKTLEQEPMREFTKEEAKAYSKTLDKMYKPTGFNVFNEPSGDLISRQAVKEHMIKYGFHAPDMTVTEFVEDLPPVNPQPKTDTDTWSIKEVADSLEKHGLMEMQEPNTGHWILQPSNKEQGERDFIWWKCSECGQVVYSETEKDRREYHAFCSRCGAKMEIPTGSEGSGEE